MTLIVRRPWTRKPEPAGWLRLDTNNPLTRGLTLAIAPELNYAFPSNIRLSHDPSSVVSAISSGRARKYTASGYTNVATTVTGDTDFAGSTTVLVLGKRGAASAGTAALFWAGDDERLDFGSSDFAVLTVSGTGVCTSTLAVPVGSEYSVISTIKPPEYTLLVNGVETTNNPGDYGSFGAVTYIGYRDGWKTTNDSISLVVKWRRTLSRFEQASIQANPWQLFSPRRIIIPSTAAAAGTYALSNPTMHLLTATSGYPRVDVTVT